jgi:hypothetical protein
VSASRRWAWVCSHRVLYHPKTTVCLIRNHIGDQNVSLATLGVGLSSFGVPTLFFTSIGLVSASRSSTSFYQRRMTCRGRYLQFPKSFFCDLWTDVVTLGVSFHHHVIRRPAYRLCCIPKLVSLSEQASLRQLSVAGVISYVMPVVVFAWLGSVC